jgi:hypothetical protein
VTWYGDLISRALIGVSSIDMVVVGLGILLRCVGTGEMAFASAFVAYGVSVF